MSSLLVFLVPYLHNTQKGLLTPEGEGTEKGLLTSEGEEGLLTLEGEEGVRVCETAQLTIAWLSSFR